MSDLYAADVQYYANRFASFTSSHNPTHPNPFVSHGKDSEIPAFRKDVSSIEDNPTRIWNPVEIYEVYKQSLVEQSKSKAPSTRFLSKKS